MCAPVPVVLRSCQRFRCGGFFFYVIIVVGGNAPIHFCRRAALFPGEIQRGGLLLWYNIHSSPLPCMFISSDCEVASRKTRHRSIHWVDTLEGKRAGLSYTFYLYKQSGCAILQSTAEH